MSMSLALARRIDAGRVTMRDLQAEAERVLAARASRSRRTAGKRAPGRKAAATKDAQAWAFYEEAKREAFKRSQFNGFPRCEVYDEVGSRCSFDGIDPDHVLGGAMRKECERLGAEGLQIMCRVHHDMKTVNTPTRGRWLNVATEHALRHGYKRLLSLVARARAKYECKRTVGIRVQTETTR